MKTIRKRAIMRSLCKSHRDDRGVRWSAVARELRKLPDCQKKYGYSRFLIEDDRHKKTIVAKSSLEALNEFIEFFYGDFTYKKSVTIEEL